MFCGTADGHIVKVSTERAMVMERWKVTDGKVTGLSFLSHKLAQNHGLAVHGVLAYIDTHRGLMMWDARKQDAAPMELPADLDTHHSSHLTTAPIEGGIFYTLPCGREHEGFIPQDDHIRKIALEANATGRLMHVLNNSTSELASGLLFPTSIAVPFTEMYALVLEPLGYRVTRVSLDGADLGATTSFLADLPVFPCAIVPTDYFAVKPDFWVALCGPHRSMWLGLLHKHPLIKNLLGWLPMEWLSGVLQTPTPAGHLMLLRVGEDAQVKEVFCDEEEDGLIPQASFILPHAGMLFIGSHDNPFLVMTNLTHHPIRPVSRPHDDL
eukprot:TRINITY_DN15937_c0_g1_i1.p1 TRINITY_DN15937_c0_g1~~TRINITY_DN15937_c0_g1_i1.p1  ORF type:complete len:325 (-),score=57.31 TRINITY_DN15937_c0_g1_i1:194-1168(-)